MAGAPAGKATEAEPLWPGPAGEALRAFLVLTCGSSVVRDEEAAGSNPATPTKVRATIRGALFARFRGLRVPPGWGRFGLRQAGED